MKRIAAILLLAFVAGCPKHQSPAIGPLREVTVASNSWAAIETTVRGILQRKIPTPRLEPEFRLRLYTLNEFKSWSLFRTVFLIGAAHDTVVRGVLGTRIDSLPGGDYGLFKIPNPWAGHQQLVVFVAREEALLVAGLTRYADRIHATFRTMILDHCARAVYYHGHNQAAEDSLGELHSFTIGVPKKWWLRQEHAGDRFVYLYGHHPDRNAFVYWEDGERVFNPVTLLRLRDSLTGRFYEGDFTLDTLWSADTVEFLGRKTLRLRGIWQNDNDTIGGPFVSYAFNHEGRFFMVDGLVYNPGRKKLDGLYQIEAVMRTFTPR